MTRDEEELQELKRMVDSLGWTIFRREQEAAVKDLRLNSWNSVKTTDQLHYMRGFLDALEGIVGYDKLLAAAEQEDGSDPV